MEEQKEFFTTRKRNSYSMYRLYVNIMLNMNIYCVLKHLKNEYYIVSAHEDNYLHLTELHTNLDAISFLIC